MDNSARLSRYVSPYPDAAWSLADRRWFEKHPGRSHRIRKPINGELSACGFDLRHTHIAVRQITPGARMRLPFAVFRLSPGQRKLLDDEYFAHVIFDDLQTIFVSAGPRMGVLDFHDMSVRADALRESMGVVQ